MRVVVTVEARFYGTPDGRVWCDNQFNFPHSFWQRYLSVFDEVLVVARVAPMQKAETDWREVTGEKVRVHALPYYLGPLQYLKQFFALKRSIRLVVAPGQAYIFRVVSVLADMLRRPVLKSGAHYAVEVVGDPWDMFGPGGIKHRLRPLLRLWFTYKLKVMCSTASAASYVTEKLLQARYPAPRAKISVAASSIILTDEALATHPRSYQAKSQWHWVTVGSLEHPHKGVDLLISAVATLCEEGFDLKLSILGDGRMRRDFEYLAKAHGLSDIVHFLGTVPAGDKVRAVVQAADLFVLASRADGMPRAMIEAMALGLGCVGTRVGGMQELLDPEWLAPINDSQALASVMRKAMTETEALSVQASSGWKKARGYHFQLLEQRRRQMYQSLRDQQEKVRG